MAYRKLFGYDKFVFHLVICGCGITVRILSNDYSRRGFTLFGWGVIWRSQQKFLEEWFWLEDTECLCFERSWDMRSRVEGWTLRGPLVRYGSAR